MSKDNPLPEQEPEKDEPVINSDAEKPFTLSALAIVGIIGSIASLISIPLAVYFYLQTKEYPQLTYYVNPAKAVVVKAGQASRLTTSYDNKIITTDITAAQLQIWNSGTKPIKKDGVLKPVVIYTENNVPILEATIRKSGREVSQLALNIDELQQGRVTILWNILERNDGGVIQLIYAGNTNEQFKFDGVMEGQSQVEQYDPAKWNYKDWSTAFIVIGILSLPLGFFAFIFRRAEKGFSSSHIAELQSSIEHDDRMSEIGRKSIAQLDEFIEEFNGKVEGAANEASSEFLNLMIENYIKERERERVRVKEYDGEKKNHTEELRRVTSGSRKTVRRFNRAIFGLILIAALGFVSAAFLLLTTQPAQPPLSF